MAQRHTCGSGVLLLALGKVRPFFVCRAQTARRCFSMPCCVTTRLSDLFPVTTFRYLLLCLIIVSAVRNTSTALPFATIRLKDSLPEPFWHGPTRTALRSMAAMLLVWRTRKRLQLCSVLSESERYGHNARRDSSHIKDLVSTLWTHVGAAVDCSSLFHRERQV